MIKLDIPQPVAAGADSESKMERQADSRAHRVSKVQPRSRLGQLLSGTGSLVVTIGYAAAPTHAGFNVARPETNAGVKNLAKWLLHLNSASPEATLAVMFLQTGALYCSRFTIGPAHAAVNIGCQEAQFRLEQLAMFLTGNGAIKEELIAELDDVQNRFNNLLREMSQPQEQASWQEKAALADHYKSEIASINRDLQKLGFFKTPPNFGAYYDIVETAAFPFVRACFTAMMYAGMKSKHFDYASTYAALVTGLYVMAMGSAQNRTLAGAQNARMRAAASASGEAFAPARAQLFTVIAPLTTQKLRANQRAQWNARTHAAMTEGVNGLMVCAGFAGALALPDVAKRTGNASLYSLSVAVQFLALWELAMEWGPGRAEAITPDFAPAIADAHNREIEDGGNYFTAGAVRAFMDSPDPAVRDKGVAQLTCGARELYDKSLRADASNVKAWTKCGADWSWPSFFQKVGQFGEAALAALTGLGVGFMLPAAPPAMHTSEGFAGLDAHTAAFVHQGLTAVMALWFIKEVAGYGQREVGTDRPPARIDRMISERGLERSETNNWHRSALVGSAGVIYGMAIQQSTEHTEGLQYVYLQAILIFALTQAMTKIVEGSRDTIGYAAGAFKARVALMTNPQPDVRAPPYPRPARFTDDPPVVEPPEPVAQQQRSDDRKQMELLAALVQYQGKLLEQLMSAGIPLGPVPAGETQGGQSSPDAAAAEQAPTPPPVITKVEREPTMRQRRVNAGDSLAA